MVTRRTVRWPLRATRLATGIIELKGIIELSVRNRQQRLEPMQFFVDSGTNVTMVPVTTAADAHIAYPVKVSTMNVRTAADTVRQRVHPGSIMVRLHGFEGREFVWPCRKLSDRGYRPAAVGVAWFGEDKPMAAASIWHRPFVADTTKDAFAKRQSQVAIALLRLDRPERVWPLFRHNSEPRLRTFLRHRLGSSAIESRKIIDLLEKETDTSVRRALILSLGEFTQDQLPADVRKLPIPRLLERYRNDPDPGIRGAVDWLLRPSHEGTTPRKVDWLQGETLRRIDQELAGKPPTGQQR